MSDQKPPEPVQQIDQPASPDKNMEIAMRNFNEYRSVLQAEFSDMEGFVVLPEPDVIEIITLEKGICTVTMVRIKTGYGKDIIISHSHVEPNNSNDIIWSSEYAEKLMDLQNKLIKERPNDFAFTCGDLHLSHHLGIGDKGDSKLVALKGFKNFIWSTTWLPKGIPEFFAAVYKIKLSVSGQSKLSLISSLKESAQVIKGKVKGLMKQIQKG